MQIHTGELPGRVPYVEVGDGPPLVIFPGMSRDCGREPRSRLHQGAVLRGLAHRTGRTIHVIYPPRGIGAGTSMAELATAHATTLNDRFAAPVDLLGVSTGGAVALQLAVDHPIAIHKLIVAGAASWLGDAGRRRLRAYGNAIAAGKSGALILAPVLTGPLLRLPTIALLWIQHRRERRVDPADMLALIDAECGFDVTARLREIAAPTLVIAGARDRAFTPELFQTTAAAIPDSRLVLFPHRGHIGALFDPRFGQEVAGFLKD